MAKCNALIIVLLAFCPATGYAEERTEPLFLLERGKVHKITKGMTVEDVYPVYGKENVYPIIEEGAEGTTYESLMINVDGEPALVAKYEKDRIIYGVEVYDRRFKTQKGISVGSEIHKVLAVYPVELVSVRNNIVGAMKDLGLSFEFDVDPESVTGKWRDDPSLIPKNTKVKSIWVRMK